MVSGIDRRINDDFQKQRVLGYRPTEIELEDSAKEYVRGDVHTNTLERAFGPFKRSIVRSFHQISVKHLDRYLDEFEFRFNNRKNGYLFRDTITRLVSAKALTYETLIA